MAQKVTEIRGQTDSHLLFLTILLVPTLPPLHGPSKQNEIVISSVAEASPFYRRLPHVSAIMSDLGFDRSTRERLVLQEESMAQSHIPIKLFLLSLPHCDR